ncbi:hypothetical protein F5Y08DRAFT_295826 [Xylaria arbuscula]|nr:hypothetical protein F5Y08DRAFT_295826 [Xylaria arbuscula]
MLVDFDAFMAFFLSSFTWVSLLPCSVRLILHLLILSRMPFSFMMSTYETRVNTAIFEYGTYLAIWRRGLRNLSLVTSISMPIGLYVITCLIMVFIRIQE